MCQPCTVKYAQALKMVDADFEAELGLTLTRQVGVSKSPGRSTVRPLPFDEGASDALQLVRFCLASMARLIWMGEEWPQDTLADIAAWVLLRVTRVRRPEAARLVEQTVRAVRFAQAVIDGRHGRQFAGVCPICNAQLWMREATDTATCPKCLRVLDRAGEQRKGLLESALDRVVPRQDVLAIVPDIYGIPVKGGTFRSWLSRGKLQPAACRVSDREPLFRIGDVADLANEVGQLMYRSA